MGGCQQHLVSACKARYSPAVTLSPQPEACANSLTPLPLSTPCLSCDCRPELPSPDPSSCRPTWAGAPCSAALAPGAWPVQRPARPRAPGCPAAGAPRPAAYPQLPVHAHGPPPWRLEATARLLQASAPVAWALRVQLWSEPLLVDVRYANPTLQCGCPLKFLPGRIHTWGRSAWWRE